MGERVLVFAPNWLGDAVMALPAVADLRRARPAATIEVAARPSVAPLVSLIPGVERGVVLHGRRASIDAVRAGGYDEALLLPNSFNVAWIARRAGVPERWGYRHDFRSLLLTRAVPPPSRVHQAAFYQRLTTALGFPAGPMEPTLSVSQEQREQGESLLAARGWDPRTPLIAVAPGAAFGSAKRWPSDRFAGAIDAASRMGARAVLVGARADMAAAREVCSRLAPSAAPIDLVGATTLTELAAVLVSCRVLLTNDSGAMHLAGALGVNVVAVFGPTNERETRPLGAGRLSVVRRPVWCSPCMLRECPLTQRCMTKVSVEDVMNEMRASL